MANLLLPELKPQSPVGTKEFQIDAHCCQKSQNKLSLQKSLKQHQLDYPKKDALFEKATKNAGFNSNDNEEMRRRYNASQKQTDVYISGSKSREKNVKKDLQPPNDYVRKLEQMIEEIKHGKRNNKSMIFALKEYNYQSERRRMERMANFDEYEKYQAESSINDISNCKDDENESLININDERSDDSYIQSNHFSMADGSRRISSYCCCVSTFWNLKRYIQYTLVPDFHRRFESDM